MSKVDLLKWMIRQVLGIDELTVEGAEQDQGRYLKETDLQRISGPDLHWERNVAVHGKGDSILEGISRP